MSPTSIDLRGSRFDHRGDRICPSAWSGPSSAAGAADARHRAAKAASALVLAALAVLAGGCGGIGAKPETAAAVAAGPDPAVLAGYGQAIAALESGDEAAAESRLQALAEAHPDYAGPLLNLALIRARHEATDEAVALLERATAVCANCAPAWNELGVLRRRQGRFADAERAYLKAVEADPAYASARFNLGILYELYLQRPELALEQYERFRELQVEDPESGTVGKWVADLERRVRAVERSARSEEIS